MAPYYLSPRHAAEYLDLSFSAFDQWARREGVPCEWVGRNRRFTRENLDRAVQVAKFRPRRRTKAA